MQQIEAENSQNNVSMIIVVIIEILVIFCILTLAAYLFYKIKLIESTQKSTVNVTDQFDSTSDSDCPLDKEGTSAQGSYKVLGYENISIDGKSQRLCCGSITDKDKETKVCSDKTNSNTATFTKINGQYSLISEMYSKDEKKCIKSYDTSGKSSEICL